MWETIRSLIILSLLPASIIGHQVSSQPTTLPFDMHVEPLASIDSRKISVDIQAKAGLVMEVHSDEVFASKNPWEPMPIASLVKLMTALVVTENIDLQDTVTVSSIIHSVSGSSMGLVVGEEISVNNLLKGLLINSGNDAAMVLSEAVSGSVDGFVTLMNERTKSLGLSQTLFVDPSGISSKNTSSAFDVAHLWKFVSQYPILRSIMGESQMTVSSIDGKYHHQLKSTNHLLGTDIGDRVIAGKTGTTPLAGQCLVILFRVKNTDREILAVVLGSDDRYKAMREIGEAFENLEWK